MERIRLLGESAKLVWSGTPGWTTANVIVSVLRGFLPLILLFLLRKVIDIITEGVTSGNDVEMPLVTLFISAVVLVFLADELSAEAGNYIRKKQSYHLEKYMYSLLHSKASSLDLINFENPEYFDKLSRAVREATWRPNNILNNLVALFRSMISLMLMAGLLLTLNWWLALILVAVNIPGIWLRLHYASVLYNFRKEQTPEERKAAYFNWLLSGDRPSREIRLFGLGSFFRSLFMKSFSNHKEEEMRIILTRTRIDAFSSLFKAGALFLVLWIITGQTLRGNITLGSMAMLILAFRQGLVYLRDVLSSVAGLYEDSLFTGDIFDFLHLRENIRAEEPVQTVASLKQELTVENVTFCYPGNTEPAIDNVSFKIRKGEIVALVGSNGSGKSTLVRLICRLYDPGSGRIMFDGRNIRNFDPMEYRKQFSVLFQDFMLYNLTVAENIMLGNIDSAPHIDKITEAARYSGVHSLIESLPKGYDTSIGPLFDESRELSWGEWQKIALARTLYRDASVYVFDEPSSALDSGSEYEIFSRFRKIVKGRTVLLISHRFTNVKLADRIIVLDRGRISESGTHEELMAAGGLYSEMFTKQKSMLENE